MPRIGVGLVVAGVLTCLALPAAYADINVVAKPKKSAKPAEPSPSVVPAPPPAPPPPPLSDAERAAKLVETGQSLLNKGETQAAAAQFEKAIELDPKNCAAHFYAGEAYVKLQDPAQARRHYEVAKQIGPDSVEGTLAEARLLGMQ